MAEAYFVATGDIDFTWVGAAPAGILWNNGTFIDTTFQSFGTPVSNAAVLHTNFPKGTLRNAADVATPQSDLWVHFTYGAETGPTAVAGNPLVLVTGGTETTAGTPVVRLRRNDALTTATRDTFTLQWHNGAGWQTVGSLGVITNVPNRFVLRVKLHATDGLIQFFAGSLGAQVGADVTGDTTGLATSIAAVELQGSAESGASTGGTFAYAQLGVFSPDVNVRYGRVAINQADAVPGGAHPVAWTGDFTAIDEQPTNDADVISTTTTNAAESWRVQQRAAATSGMTVVLFGQTMRARVGATGPQNLQLTVYVGGTEYTSGDLSGVTSAYATHRYQWSANPAAPSTPITPATFDAFRWGVKATA